MLKIGIIGLPNVGKSSLFNLITHSTIEVANYPFATIEPNIGIVELKDLRIKKLVTLYKSKKVIFPLIKFWDIAGLVKGASEGQGMGNQFLHHIQNADAIIHIVRSFQNKEILHVHNEVNPLYDFEIVNLELILSDLQTVRKKIVKTENIKKSNNSIEVKKEYELLTSINHCLNQNQMLNSQKWTSEEQDYINSMNLLTSKKTLVIINVSEKFFSDFATNSIYQNFVKVLKKQKIKYLPLAIEFEKNIKDLPASDVDFLRTEYQIPPEFFYNFLQKSHEMLGLSIFFTAGPKETRGWSFLNNSNAKQCAGIIHTDFARGFIRCNILPYEKLIAAGSEQKAKEQGFVRTEGKEYIIKDGDICHFLFNV